MPNKKDFHILYTVPKILGFPSTCQNVCTFITQSELQSCNSARLFVSFKANNNVQRRLKTLRVNIMKINLDTKTDLNN